MSPPQPAIDRKAQAILGTIAAAGRPETISTTRLEDAIILATRTYRRDRMKELIRALEVLGYIEMSETPGVWRLRYERAGLATEGG